ncbi:MAG: universal stress protein [Myxococcota bacterium]
MRSIETIVVGTDFSPCASAGLRAVEALCRMWPVREVHVLAVVAPVVVSTPLEPVEDASAGALAAARAQLRRLELDVGAATLVTVAKLGSPAGQIADYAQERQADLIVAASHGRTGVPRAVLGSVTANLIRLSTVPVLVVPSKGGTFKESFQEVLAAVDLSAVSLPLLKEAGLWAQQGGGQVRVLSMFETPLVATEPGELLPHYLGSAESAALVEAYENSVRGLVKKADMPVTTHVDVVAKAPAGQAVVEVAHLLDVDMVVVGTSGHSALHRWLVGSTANRVLEAAARPVLVVPRAIRAASEEPASLAFEPAQA